MSDKAAIIKEAQKYLSRGQIDKAIAEWEKLIKEYPDPNTFNTIGDLYLKKGDKVKAVDFFHKAANIFRQEGFSLKALAVYKKILNVNPSDTGSLLSLAELNEGKGLITDAIKFYLAAADSLSKEGKKEKIYEIYNKILELSPGNLPLRNKIAEIYIKEGLITEAVNEYLYLANLYFEKQEIEKSEEYYNKVLKHQPVNKEAILGIINIYERTGQIDSLLEKCNDAVSIFLDDIDILIRCAEVYISVQKFDEAIQCLTKIKEIEPGNVKARRFLGDIYIKENNIEKAWEEYLPVLDEMILEEKYEDAINQLNIFKEIDPIETGKRLVSLYRQLDEQVRVAEELVSLGDAFLKKDFKKEALNCYREALLINPEDDILKNKAIELERKIKTDYISDSERTIEEVITEADIFIKYGLTESAKDILEAYVEKEPENIELHEKLKSIYVDLGEKEKAVGECLVLSELYKKANDADMSSNILKEAFSINPEDQRISGIEIPSFEKEYAAASNNAPVIEDYSEELAEADFYFKQGLIDEAREILERLYSIFPENEEIKERLSSFYQVVEAGKSIQEVEKKNVPITIKEESLEVAEEASEEIAEPILDSDVMDIFNEFKKGLEKELEEEDYETHYNLGIAYKEMGLIDDAIREFQTSRKDPNRFISSSNMLGVCYIEKGLYPLAIEVLKSAIEKMQDRGESYWAMKYDLAEAYEKNGNIKEAFDCYTEVYGWNSKFRAVSDKIDDLKKRITEGVEQKKPRDRKDRVSYI